MHKAFDLSFMLCLDRDDITVSTDGIDAVLKVLLVFSDQGLYFVLYASGFLLQGFSDLKKSLACVVGEFVIADNGIVDGAFKIPQRRDAERDLS